jgi:hypothetical protein
MLVLHDLFEVFYNIDNIDLFAADRETMIDPDTHITLRLSIPQVKVLKPISKNLVTALGIEDLEDFVYRFHVVSFLIVYDSV